MNIVSSFGFRLPVEAAPGNTVLTHANVVMRFKGGIERIHGFYVFYDNKNIDNRLCIDTRYSSTSYVVNL